MSVTTAIASQTLRRIFARRRAWIFALVATLPLVLAFVYRLTSEDRDGDRLAFLMTVNRDLIVGVLTPLVALMAATSAIGDEIEDGTLVYLLLTPVARSRIIGAKYIAALVATFAAAAIATVFGWISLLSEEVPPAFVSAFVVGTAAASTLYCAVFICLGVFTRRATVFGALYVVVFENVLARSFAGIDTFSVRALSLTAAAWAGGDASATASLGSAGANESGIVAVLIAATALGLAARKLARYELLERA